MGNGVRITTSVMKVASAFLTDVAADRYGLELMHDTGLASGTLYPILVRLERAGWIESHWEDIDPVVQGRPARRYYRLTPTGVANSRHELALIHQQLSRATGVIGQARKA
jgi:DNA-binding PadR family transcriptional regulator